MLCWWSLDLETYSKRALLQGEGGWGLKRTSVDWPKHPEYDLEEVAETANEIAYGGIRKVLQGLMAGT